MSFSCVESNSLFSCLAFLSCLVFSFLVLSRLSFSLCFCLRVVLCGRGVVVVVVCVWCVCLVSVCVCVCCGTVKQREKKPCTRSKRLRVYIRNVRVCTGTNPTCFMHVGLVPVHTGVLNAHTGVFQRPQPPTQIQPTHTHNQQLTRQARQDKTRQDKTRQDKTRQDKTRQDKTRQDKTRQDKTRQDKTRPDKSRQDKCIYIHTYAYINTDLYQYLYLYTYIYIHEARPPNISGHLSVLLAPRTFSGLI